MQALVERYSGPLFGLGLRLLGDRGSAEELVQDTFVRLWRSAGRYDPERGAVRTFIYAIARNAAGDLRRRVASRPLDVAMEPEASTVPRHEPFERLVTSLEVRAALEALSDNHRETLEMFYDQDLSQPQIAERLGIPLGTVKSRCYHGLRALRAELERRGIGT